MKEIKLSNEAGRLVTVRVGDTAKVELDIHGVQANTIQIEHIWPPATTQSTRAVILADDESWGS